MLADRLTNARIAEKLGGFSIIVKNHNPAKGRHARRKEGMVNWELKKDD